MSSMSSEKLRQKLENKMYHTFVNQHMHPPFIDTKKLDLLSLLFHQVALTEEEKYEQMVSIMLVQIALDTHERVTVDQEPLSEELERQLSVLAGDYYSSLYYQSLAKLKEIRLIQIIAKAIKQVNEEKIRLYQFEIRTWEELMDTYSTIEASLFTSVGKYFNLPVTYLDYISHSLLLNKLTQEKAQIQKDQFSYIKEYVLRKQIELNEPSMIEAIQKEIEAQERQLKALTCQGAVDSRQLEDRSDHPILLSLVEEG